MTFEQIAENIGRVVTEKNASYGSSFQFTGDILKIYFPLGVRPDQYQDMLLIARISDKLFRVATRKDAFDESPYSDIAGYGILGVFNDVSKKKSGIQS